MKAWPGSRVARAPTAATTLSQLARAIGFWPTTAAGACSQRPMHGAGDLARQAVADANGQRRRRGLAFLDDVEVVIEAGDFVDLGLRQAHLLCQGGEMRRREVAEAILDLVQVLDQEVTLARLGAEKRLDLRQRPGIDASPSRRRALALPRRRLRRDRDDRAGKAQSSPAPRAHWYFAPSTATGISVE